ncbi:MAG: hypothetical protein U5K00_01690 [Melioribacteraceae bacterium]|nr:hypothetical protein [Melioribacteraceae bacterium]
MTVAGEGLIATKYDTLGNFVWEELYEGDMKDPDSTLWTNFALGIGVDNENSVYLTGHKRNSRKILYGGKVQTSYYVRAK